MSGRTGTSSAAGIVDPAMLPAIPRDREGIVFNAPWEAKAFAIVVLLHRRRCFTWQEWTDALSARIATAANAAPTGTEPGYYALWLAAAEELVAAKGLCLKDELAARKDVLAAEHPHP